MPQVQYLGEQETFTPEQVYAMLLTKLKETTEINLLRKVVDCVIAVGDKTLAMNSPTGYGFEITVGLFEPCPNLFSISDYVPYE